MTKVRRYFWVRSPKSSVVHRSFAPHMVEGELTVCNRAMQAGWSYYYGLRNVPNGSSICAQCGT